MNLSQPQISIRELRTFVSKANLVIYHNLFLKTLKKISSAFWILFKLFVTTEAVGFFSTTRHSRLKGISEQIWTTFKTIPQQRGHGGYIDDESDRSFMLVRFYPIDMISFCCLKSKYFTCRFKILLLHTRRISELRTWGEGENGSGRQLTSSRLSRSESYGVNL